MPYRNKKKTKRKTYRKRRRQSQRTAMTTPSGMPLARTTNLRYCDSITLNSTSGVLGRRLFRANSVFDPDYSGTGHQPMGFDQWALLYNHYVVKGSKITVTFRNNDGNNVSEFPSAVGIYLSDSPTTSYTNYTSLVEARRGSHRMLQHFQTPKISGYFSAKKFYNITNIKDNFSRLGATTGANPTEDAYYNVYYQALGTTGAISIDVVIDYVVEFSEPKDLAPS